MSKRKEFPEEAYEYKPYNNRCGTNEHWVKTYTTKNGVVIHGHCAKDPSYSITKDRKLKVLR
jgi:hypothetical protein